MYYDSTYMYLCAMYNAKHTSEMGIVCQFVSQVKQVISLSVLLASAPHVTKPTAVNTVHQCLPSYQLSGRKILTLASENGIGFILDVIISVMYYTTMLHNTALYDE